MDLNEIDYLGIDRVLKRGSGDIIAKTDDALLIRVRISGAHMLACEDKNIGMNLLSRYIGADCGLLMVSDYSLGMIAYKKFGFAEKLECYQVAYYGEKPEIKTGLTVREAGENDLDVLIENYDLISPDELETAVSRKSILLGYNEDQLVGFIGEHLEGSMGMLYVFPQFRRRGFGEALQKHLIAGTIDKGFIPFGQVEKGNYASLALQKKLGMTVFENLIVWMWK